MKYPRGKRFVRFVFLFLFSTGLWAAGFFIPPLLQLARALSPGELLINSVQITGGSGQTDNDYVRIYNSSSTAIDLNGLRLVKRTKTGTSDTTIKSWTSPLLLNPGAVYTWANSSNGFAASINADTFSTQTLSNDNSVAIRQGAENSGSIIDAVGWGTADNALAETAPFAQNPGANEYIERISYQDTDNNALDFRLVVPVPAATCGNGIMEQGESCDDENIANDDGCDSSCQLETPQPLCGNGNIETGEECDDGNSSGNDSCSAACEIINNLPPESPSGNEDDARVYINEFVPDPVSGGSEWIELYSPSDSPVPLTNWTLEDGAGTKTKITGNNQIGGDNHFFAIPKSAGSLNNDGDIIILRDTNGTIKHQVAYGDWDDGDISDNAPTAPDPYSIARIPTATDSGSDSQNYDLTSMLTMWAANIIKAPVIENDSEEETDTATDWDYSKTVEVSEIFPNPLGIDAEHASDEFIELHNTGDANVRLDGWRIEIGDKQYIHEFKETTVLKAGTYLAVRGGSGFALANNGGTLKLFQPARLTALQTVTYKDAAEGQSWVLLPTTNPANKLWKWTLVPTPGTLNTIASLPIATFSINGSLAVNKPLVFDSSDSNGGPALSYAWDFGDKSTSTQPNPDHSYAKAGTYETRLTLSNAYGSSVFSKKISIAESSDLKAATLDDAKTGNEDIPHIRFISILPNPEGADGSKEWVEIQNDEITTVSLEGWRINAKSKKGPLLNASLEIDPEERLRLDGDYLPTLGNTSESLTLVAPDGTTVDTVSYAKAPEDEAYSLVGDIWEWSEGGSEDGDDLHIASAGKSTANKNQRISGLVAALPGMFSAQYFYIKIDTQDLLYQIYNSKKLFPKLQLGQRVSVSGEQSMVAAGPRFKTTSADDISVSEAESLPVPTVSSALNLKEAPHPRLARVQGEVTSKKSPRMIITDATGDVEVYLAKGTGLSITNYALGDKLTVSGITQIDGEMIRLMPRSEADILFTDGPPEVTATASPDTVMEELKNKSRDAKRSTLPYMIMAAVAIAGGGAYAIWKFLKK